MLTAPAAAAAAPAAEAAPAEEAAPVTEEEIDQLITHFQTVSPADLRALFNVFDAFLNPPAPKGARAPHRRQRTFNFDPFAALPNWGVADADQSASRETAAGGVSVTCRRQPLRARGRP